MVLVEVVVNKVLSKQDSPLSSRQSQRTFSLKIVMKTYINLAELMKSERIAYSPTLWLSFTTHCSQDQNLGFLGYIYLQELSVLAKAEKLALIQLALDLL